MSHEETRAGMVAIVGLPNAGKSSLLNAMLGTKLAIVTPAAQTTRQRVVGIDTRDGVQMVFLDTPGLVDPAYLLHESMLLIVRQAVADADVVVLLLDGTRPPPVLASELQAALPGMGRLVVAINKEDLAPASNVDGLREWSRASFGVDPVTVSALTGAGIEGLRREVAAGLPVSPFLYPDDDLSTQNLRFFVAERIRETIFEMYREEIPYSVAVRVEEFQEKVESTYIRATIFVERATQKGILLGQKGVAIRELGRLSRAKVEELLETGVYLDLWVKVLPKWRKSPLELKRFGFPVPPER